MADGFEFDEYYTNDTVKTEAAIDRSGVNLQNPTEDSEIVTNNVVYYISEISVKSSETDLDYAVVPEGVRLCIAEPDPNDPSDIMRTTYYFLRRWHRLGEAADSGMAPTWEPHGDREQYFFGEHFDDGSFQYSLIDDSNGVVTPVYSFRATVYPRHETEVNRAVSQKNGTVGSLIDQNPIMDAQVMKLLYGGLGIYGGRWKGLRWLSRVWDGKTGTGDRAVMGYDTFKRRMDALADICQENDVGFSVTYYDQSYAKEVSEEDATAEDYKADRARARLKHARYRSALEQADVTRTDMSSNATFDEAYGTYLPQFISKGLSEGFLDRVDGTSVNVTALIPPVKTIIQSYFYPADELESDFSGLFKQVLDAISRVPFAWKFVSKSTKRALSRVKASYTYRPAGSERMAFDMDALHAALLNPKNGTGHSFWYRGLPRAVQVGSISGKSWIVGPREITQSGISETRVFAWEADQGDVYCTYEGASDAAANWFDKAYTTVDWDMLVDMLVDYYNGAVASGKEPGTVVDAGIVKDVVTESIDDPSAAFGDSGSKLHQLIATHLTFWGWFANVCGYMNLFRKFAKDPPNPGNGINVYRACDTWKANNLDTAPFDVWKLTVAGGPLELSDVFPSGSYDIMAWEEGVDHDASSYKETDLFAPEFRDEWVDIAKKPTESFGNAIEAVSVMRDAYKQMCRATTAQVMVMGPLLSARAILALDDISDDLDELYDLCNKLTWYQRMTEESPFTNKSMIEDTGSDTMLSSFPAHLMFPVKMYKKVRVKYRRFGRTRHKMVKRSIGVRWAEVVFTDSSVYGEYPVVREAAGETVQYSGTYEADRSGDNVLLLLEPPLPGKVLDAGKGVAVFSGGQRVEFSVLSDVVISLYGELSAGAGSLRSFKVPLAPSQDDGSREPVTINYKLPDLPYDAEIRRKAFVDYGSLSQAPGFEQVRNAEGSDVSHPGWIVFHQSSDRIEDVREGLGIHDKLAMLLSILKGKFGDSRVQLVETYRSMYDQERMCSGGPESAFLSWHNYGLAAKILILRPDGRTPIESGDEEDVKALTEIARAFTDCCASGQVGVPCNLVWCARLAAGPSLFDWEFLPVGVGHKDAPAFRDATMDQSDPVHEYSLVDVTANDYVVGRPPDDGRPYVLSTSPALERARVYGGHKYLRPEYIRNYPSADDIVLYDAREFVDLVQLKMNANGTGKPESGSLYEWKALNPHSCEQLIRYYAMIGSISAAKALIAGDYVERYLPIEEQFYNTSPVDYVKGMLGPHYEEVRISVTRDGESSYISLHDGILHVKALETYPKNEPTRFDMHKQQKVDGEHMVWGTWSDGVFYPESERPVPYIDSESPVLSGYRTVEETDSSTGATGKVTVVTGGEALYLHQALASRIHSRFDEIRKMFESFGGSLMYDRFADSPNSGMADMLENEFGLIKAQDLLSFDELEENLFGVGATVPGDRVVEDGSIYEKVVNNAQLAGIRRASLTRGHIHVKDLPSNADGKTLYDIMLKGKGYMANDLI